MTTPYVPVPALLPASITLPQDVVDQVVVGTVNPPFQDLANAVAWQEEIRAACFQAVIANGTYAAAVGLDLDPTGSIQQGVTITGSNKRILFAASGLYMVNFQVTGLSTDPPAFIDAYQLGLYKIATSVSVALATGAGTTGDMLNINGAGLFQVVAGEEYELRTPPGGGGGGYALTVESTGLANALFNKITITRVQ
jgi:hypothetical protein